MELEMEKDKNEIRVCQKKNEIREEDGTGIRCRVSPNFNLGIQVYFQLSIF